MLFCFGCGGLWGGDMVTERELARLQALLAADKGDLFYHWSAWERLRDEVLRLDRKSVV